MLSQSPFGQTAVACVLAVLSHCSCPANFRCPARYSEIGRDTRIDFQGTSICAASTHQITLQAYGLRGHSRVSIFSPYTFLSGGFE